MADVVRLARPDPERDAYEFEVRELCALAGADDWAPQFLAAHTPLEIVTDHCIWLVFRRKPPRMLARQRARLHGPAGTRRRPLPRWFGRYQNTSA